MTLPAVNPGVIAFLAALEHPRKAEIEILRALILATDPAIREEVKWNAPSFQTTVHFATFRLQPGNTVQIVFHTGAKVRTMPLKMQIDDPGGLLKWVTPDRAVATFTDLDDIEGKRAALTLIVRQWITQL